MSSCVYGVLVKLPPEGETLLSAKGPPSSEIEVAAIPLWLRILVMVLRALFFGALPWGSRCVYGSSSIFSCFPRGRTYIGLGFVSALWSPPSHWRWPLPSGNNLRARPWRYPVQRCDFGGHLLSRGQLLSKAAMASSPCRHGPGTLCGSTSFRCVSETLVGQWVWS